MEMNEIGQDLAERNAHTGLPVACVSVVTPAEVSLQELADRGTYMYQKTVASLIAVGQFLLDVKSTRRPGEWGQLFRDHPRHVPKPMPFTSRTGHMLRAIAEHPVLSDRNNCSILPFSVRTLYELSRHSPQLVTDGIAKGIVYPEMERYEAEGLQALVNGWDPDSRGEFPIIDKNIKLSHECPRCHYRWSGKPSPRDRSIKKGGLARGAGQKRRDKASG